MGSGIVDLNEKPFEGIVQYALLQKDMKPICRIKCSNLPVKLSSCWVISDFGPSTTYRQLDLQQCEIYPDPESTRQKKEWRNFMYFLWKNKKAAVVNFKGCYFYLLAPNEHSEFLHATVLYNMSRLVGFDDQEMSGENFNGEGNSSKDRNRISSKSGQHWHSGRSSVAAEKEGLMSELQRSFVRTDPSYLRTLSQTHAGWAFGAIAELVDNSRDANSSKLAISIECLYYKKMGEKIPVLSVVDDGIGMSNCEIVKMLSFGHKHPDEENLDRIGRFGIGFKTGAMKLGADVLVLTQTTGSRSVALLSQSYNEHKDNLEIPIITYRKIGAFMEVDTSVQSEALAKMNLNAIKEFSPFNEYLIGERLGLFGEMVTGTQIYIWNLDKWGSDYSLEWVDGGNTVGGNLHQSQGNILIRSRRQRLRPGQISQKIPLDYSLQAYLEVIFLDPRMRIYVQGSLVKSRPLAKSLNNTEVVKGTIMGKSIQLTLGRSEVEWERMNGGIFLYWHGRLIEAYKRVGGMMHNADVGRGVLGVVDVSDLMDDGKGYVWVLNNKQGFQDCEAYAKLEEWLGNKVDEYWDEHFDRVDLDECQEKYKPDEEWVQCDKCRKWRKLNKGFNSDSLPPEWFCYMPPFSRNCEAPEQQIARGVVTVGTKRSRYEKDSQSQKDEAQTKAKNISPTKKQKLKNSDGNGSPLFKQSCEADSSSRTTS